MISKEAVQSLLKQVEYFLSGHDKEVLDNMARGISEKFTKNLAEAQNAYYKDYLIVRKSFKTQKQQLQNLFAKCKPTQQADPSMTVDKLNPVQQLELDQFKRLTADIHRKALYNTGILQKFEFSFSTTNYEVAALQEEVALLRTQLDEMKELIYDAPLLVSIKEKMALQQKLQQNLVYYKNMHSKIMNSPIPKQDEVEIKAEGYMADVRRACLEHKKVEEAVLVINSKNGKISLEEYESLLEVLSLMRNLRSLNIRIMDCEFDEVKCKLIKGKLKRLRVLDKFRMQNYYHECKMGVFVDFPWHPFRKAIHVFSGKW